MPTVEHHFMVLFIRFAFVLWLCCSIHATAVGTTIVHSPSVRSVAEKDGSLNGILSRLRISGDEIVAKKQEQMRVFRKKKLAFLPDGVKNSLASATATAVVKIILQPLDTIKTIQQARPNIKLGPIKAAAEVIKNRGIVGLWSGIGISILGSSPSGAVYFGVYSSVKTHITKYFSPQYKLVAVAISAAIGNTFASVLRAPYEVLKQRIQTGRHTGAWEAMTHSWRTEGPFGLFDKGKLTSQIFRDVPYAIVTLVSYEILQGAVVSAIRRHKKKLAEDAAAAAAVATTSTPVKSSKKGHTDGTKGGSSSSTTPSTPTSVLPSKPTRHDPITAAVSAMFGNDNNKKLRNALCGSMAGGFGSFATTPMDVVKTRMMTSSQSSSVLEAVVRIAKDEGLMTFFVGVGPRLMHKIPANGLFFLSYEAFRTFLGVSNTGSDE